MSSVISISQTFIYHNRTTKFRLVLISSVGFLLLLTLLSLIGADQKINGLFFPANQWELGKLPFFKWLYDWGPLPSLLLGLTSMIWATVVLLKEKSFSKCTPYAFPFLTLVIGPGLIVNSIFKEHWGRARPRQIDLYGGTLAYTDFYKPNLETNGKSFPSGHASVGFHLCCLAFIRKNPFTPACFTFGIIWGLLIGLARILQGGHFITDVIASCYFVLLTCILLAPEKNLKKMIE